MKSIIILVIGFTLTITCYSQGVFTNDVNSALQKVIQDYPNHFINLKGAQVAGNLGNIQYHSTVEVPGSVNCVLTQYSTTKKEIYNWKCVMLESEKFREAKNKFTELYNQIRNTIVKIEGEKPFILNGKYEAPSEDKKFTSVIFELLPATGSIQKLKVELILQHTINEWKLILAVYDEESRSDGQHDLTDRY
jgi:predicted SnoaL-like aldol condensation-catalyzing enzyme